MAGSQQSAGTRLEQPAEDTEIQVEVRSPARGRISVEPLVIHADAYTVDAVLHVLSALPDFAGDYTGVNEITSFWQQYAQATGGSSVANMDQMVTNDDFIVQLAGMAAQPADTQMQWSVCWVRRIAGGRIAEEWLISSSLSDPEGTRKGWARPAD